MKRDKEENSLYGMDNNNVPLLPSREDTGRTKHFAIYRSTYSVYGNCIMKINKTNLSTVNDYTLLIN